MRNRPRLTVVVSERARDALDERIRMLHAAADVDEVLVARGPMPPRGWLRKRPRPYLLDVNSVTAALAAELLARGIPYVIDTGDDPSTLARSSRGPVAARAHGAVERIVIGGARAVVCRGSFHQAVLRTKTSAPIYWAPDTVPDSIVDASDVPAAHDDVIATFGSASEPRSGDRAYGWEVIDIVARLPQLTGVIVVRGSGLACLRGRAHRFGVSDRVVIEGGRPLGELAGRLSAAAFITSVQSDDLAGWVRTTGKLPIALGLGKVLVTTRVGEASRVLPDDLLVTPGSDEEVVEGMATVVERGIPSGWSSMARELAQPFRRSNVAVNLAGFLNAV